MRRYLAYLLVCIAALIAGVTVGHILTDFGLYLIDPNTKWYAVGRTALRALPVAVVTATAAYPLLRRYVFDASGSVARYAGAWVGLMLIGEGIAAALAAGMLSGTLAVLLMLVIAAVPGYLLMRDWVFVRQRRGGTS